MASSRMQRIGSTLWPTLQTFQVYGANTNVGKTIVSTVLAKAFREKLKSKVHYLKPVSTGANEHADTRHINRFTDGINTETIFQFSRPVSPHLAARADGYVPQDYEIVSKTYEALLQSAKRGDNVSIVETAGGVLSPAPSGSLQADVFRPLRMPVLYVGDFHLGGISTTISGYESLRVRGYDVLLHLIFEEEEYQNVKYLGDYFAARGVPTLALPKPPAPLKDAEADAEAMWQYYSDVTSLDIIYKQLDDLAAAHGERIATLKGMPARAERAIWYPFTQHKGRTADDIMVIDSAYKNNFDALYPQQTKPDQSLLRAALDASSSWWTQGLGHGNPQLALAAAYAAGRYGHVMFTGNVYEPALKIAELLLEHHKNPRLAKVFFTDNGSTGMEVALKMALRATSLRYGWDHSKEKVEILGLKGSYHGDTMGVVDTSEPSAYNEAIPWYNPKGYWFDYPTIKMKNGRWIIDVPEALQAKLGTARTLSDDLNDVFDEKRIGSDLYKKYEEYIEETLEQLRREGRKFGALVIEPVILGAGGMIFADPIFQHALVSVIRNSPHLFHPSAKRTPNTPDNWTGLPIVFDEVFTGLYRLGHFNTNGLVHAQPDIVVNAKLLTGGLIPLATTTASKAIFEAFLGDTKSDALLHGHSYTAHAAGCQVAVESVGIMRKMDTEGTWIKEFGEGWLANADSSSSTSSPSTSLESAPTTTNKPITWSVWRQPDVAALSSLPNVSGVIALGTVLAITLRDKKTPSSGSSSGGYESNATAGIQKRLLRIGEEGWSVHSRVLGNVMYFMTSLTVSGRTTEALARRIMEELKKG